MRLALYGGLSTLLAVGVIFNAMHQRSNFYAACVYLSKSSACVMVRCSGVYTCAHKCTYILMLFTQYRFCSIWDFWWQCASGKLCRRSSLAICVPLKSRWVLGTSNAKNFCFFLKQKISISICTNDHGMLSRKRAWQWRSFEKSSTYNL